MNEAHSQGDGKRHINHHLKRGPTSTYFRGRPEMSVSQGAKKLKLIPERELRVAMVVQSQGSFEVQREEKWSEMIIKELIWVNEVHA